jgi:hypothetical protein
MGRSSRDLGPYDAAVGSKLPDADLSRGAKSRAVGRRAQIHQGGARFSAVHAKGSQRREL